MMDFIQTWLPIAKDAVTMFAAGVAVYVGLTGLQTWQRQLRGNAEYDLARRVLVSVYKLRAAINNCRLIEVEMDSEIVDITKKIHDSLFDKLDEAQADLDVELLEGEAVWGSEPDYRYNVIMLQTLVQILQAAYSSYYASYTLVTAPKAEAYKILFTTGVFAKDDFTTRIGKTITDAENFLRPKLTMKQVKRKNKHWWDRFRRQKK
jgi:hypothetical protein